MNKIYERSISVKKNFKKIILLFTVGIILGLSIIPVFGTAYSIWGYYGPVLGYSYRNQSACVDWSDSSMSGFAQVETQDGGNAPTGYMGVQAWLYKDDVLILTSGWYYNNCCTPMFDPCPCVGKYTPHLVAQRTA